MKYKITLLHAEPKISVLKTLHSVFLVKYHCEEQDACLKPDTQDTFLKSDWTNHLSHSLPVGNSLMLRIDATADTRRSSPPRGEPQ